MGKRPSTGFNIITSLLTVTFFSSLSLGIVYELTKAPIANAAIQKKINAIRDVVPDFDNNPLDEAYVVKVDDEDFLFYPAMKENAIVGLAVETTTAKGFSGTIKLLVGFLSNGSIHRIQVLESQETPGLGDKIRPEKSNFTQQFLEKNPDHFVFKVKKDGGDVDAITAATISSRAFCDAVQKSYIAFLQGRDQ